MGGEGSGPKVRFDDLYHEHTRFLTREARTKQNELKTAISELVLFQLHNAKESQLLKPVSIEALPKFYSDVTDGLFEKYGSVFSRENIENQVKRCIGKSTEELRGQLTKIEKDLKAKALMEMYILADEVFAEQQKAEELLKTEFGDKPSHIIEEENQEKEMAFREDIWLNSMGFLKNKGFAFYPSKLASDSFVFSYSLGDPADPYKYELYQHDPYPHLTTRRHRPKFLHHPNIQAWRSEEAEQTVKLKEAFETVWREIERHEQIRVQRQKQALTQIKPWLIQCIEYGYMDSKILSGIRKAAWIRPYEKPVMDLVNSLRKEGYKPRDGKFKVVMVAEDEPKTASPELTQKFDQAAVAFIGQGLTDEEILKQIELMTPELVGLSNPNFPQFALWRGRLRLIRQQTEPTQTSQSVTQEKGKVTRMKVP